MNYPRIAVAAAAAFVASVALGFLVNDILLADLYQANAAALRPDEAMGPRVGVGILALLPAYFAFAYVYARGYEGGNGMAEGARYGAVMGVLVIGVAIVWQWVLYPISNTMGLAIAIVSFLEMVLYGTIVGAVYKPAATQARSTTAV